MKFTIDEIIDITNAKILFKADDTQALKSEISTDTRKIKKNDLYMPLIGEKFDGHDFIDKALENGALGYFTSKSGIIKKDAKIVLKVENTLEAYLSIANYYKNKISPKTVAITGSSGKTTTKEMIATVCSQYFKTHKTLLNHNNEVGLAQTMLTMPEDTEILIVEMGMRGLGEIELLSKYTQPDIAVITNIGCAHLERLGSVENIARAKCEISKYQNKNGVLICEDSELAQKFVNFSGEKIFIDIEKLISNKTLEIKNLTQNGSEFVYKNKKYELNIEGEYNIQNAVFAIEAAEKLKIPYEFVKKGLFDYAPIENRWQIKECCGYRIINDSYNANPESMKCALKTFLTLYGSPKVVVLGDMKELGEKEKLYHAEIGEFLNNYDVNLLITVGELAEIIARNTYCKSVSFSDTTKVASYIKKHVEIGAAMLFKASRSLKLEKIIEEIEKQ